MSDDPKSIWIFESDGRSVPRAGDWVDEQSEAPEGAPEYRRADLPPTLSADLIRLRAEVATLRASEARMREALERADRALKPFADTVFNDNGDCTISDTYLLTDVDFCNAYSARNIARAALQGETK